ncbi:MAG: PspA/IM30 family protein [Myxococcota bacterium]|jgi:phage shock protein A|nr:PspA/IM30 family protein [Myxococcota bacterium]
MGILERVHRIVRANVNQMLDKAEDPQRSLQLHLEELREGAREARQELIRLAADEKLARRKHSELLEESHRWEERAMTALRAGDEELARRALAYKHEVDLKAAELLRQADLSAEYSGQLEGQVALLERKSELATQRTASLAERAARRAPSSVRGSSLPGVDAPMPDPLGDEPAFAEFGRLDSRIDEMDAQLAAYAELNAGLFDPAREELDRRFQELERDAGLDAGMADLKRRLSEK